MFSTPLLPPEPTRLPAGVRAWIGARLSGPPRGTRTTRYRTVIFHLDRLGDAVLALSAIRVLLQGQPESECLLVTSDTEAPLLALEFPHLPRIVLPTHAPGIVSHVWPIYRRERPQFSPIHADQVFCLSHNRNLYKQIALSWIGTSKLQQLDRTTYPTHFPVDSCFELEAHRQLLAAGLNRPVTREEILPAFTRIVPQDGDELLVCPFAGSPERQLPPDRLISILTHWRQRGRAPITFCGPPNQIDALRQLVSASTQAGLGDVNFVCPDDMAQLVHRIAQAGAVLAIESGPAHLATALDKRVTIIVGGGTHGLCSPWRRSSRQQIVMHRLPCYGCGWQCTQPAILCLNEIDTAAAATTLPLF